MKVVWLADRLSTVSSEKTEITIKINKQTKKEKTLPLVHTWTYT